MTKTVKKLFVTILAIFTVFFFGGIISLNRTDNQHVKAETITELTVKSVTYQGVRSNGKQMKIDVVFNEDVNIQELFQEYFGSKYTSEYGSVPFEVNGDVASKQTPPPSGSFVFDSTLSTRNAVRIYLSVDYSAIESISFKKGTTIASDSLVIAEGSTWAPTSTLSSGTYSSAGTVAFEKAADIESVTEIGITHVYYAGIHGASGARPNRYMFDVAFNYDFSDTRDVTGCIYRFGTGVAYVNDVDVATQFAENDLWYSAGTSWADGDCTDANAFRMYIYADGDCSTFESLKFTKDFKFTLKGVTYQLDNDYEFVSYAALTNGGPVDGQGVMELFKTETLDDALPEIKVTGMNISGFRGANNDFLVDITFDKAVMKAFMGWRKNTFLVNGQTPYIGKPGTANRSYPMVQFAETGESMARVFLVGKASDYSTSLGYLNEIDSISVLKGMKIQLADGTYAQVKADATFMAKSTITSSNDADRNLFPENADNEEESVTEIGITHVYYAGIHGAFGARPNRYMFDVAFNYDFSDTRDVTGCIYRFGTGVAYVNDVDVATQFAENDLWYSAGTSWADGDCTDANAFRMYIYADGDCSTFESLKFTKDFKFTLKGVTYQLDNDYEFVSYAALTNGGPVDGQGVMELFKTETLDDALPEIKVTGMNISGFRGANNDFLVDITFDKAVMKAFMGWRKNTFLVNGQTPYIGKPGTANRSYPMVQFAETGESMARVFLVGKASDYSTSLGYLNEIDSISVLKGMKIQLADGTYAQVKADATFMAKSTITSSNGAEDELISENIYNAIQGVMDTLHTEGASIKVSGIQGLRFMNVVDATAKAALDAVATVTYGTVLTNTEIGTADVKADVWYDDAQTQYTATIKGFTTNEHYNLVFTATAYIDVQLPSGKVMRFNATASESRSIAYVADAAVKDYQTSYNETDGYVYEVETGKFYKTDFTTDQLAYLRAIAATYEA